MEKNKKKYKELSKATIEKILNCCDFDEKSRKYESKKDIFLLKSISETFEGKNKNDKPFLLKDILEQPTKDTFKFTGINDFEYICKISASILKISEDKKIISKDQIIASDFESKEKEQIFAKSAGVVYLITFPWKKKEYFIKIGQTRNQFKSRLSSYNCGSLSNWRTASTTNIKMVQSMVATRGTFNLYLYDCKEFSKYEWHGAESSSFSSSKSLAYENILLNKFEEQYKKKPLANIQIKATEI